MNIFLEEHLSIINLFNKHEVKFLLVGGYAVIMYGYMRTTGDMDLWVEPTNENKLKIYNALIEAEFDKDDMDYLLQTDFTTVVVFSIGSEPQKIDIMTKINIVKFDEAYNQKIVFINEEVEIPLIHLNDLVLSKINTGRLKDKADIEELQKINNNPLE